MKKDIDIVREQLNREPDGFQEVVRRMPDGTPAVIRVASVVDGVPFPTLYWISNPSLTGMIHKYESDGVTNRIQQMVDEDKAFQQRLSEDNLAYIRKRESYFDKQINSELDRLGIQKSFSKKGIGGVANFARVRCLHAYLAAHTVVPNLVGELLTNCYGAEDPLVIALSQLN